MRALDDSESAADIAADAAIPTETMPAADAA